MQSPLRSFGVIFSKPLFLHSIRFHHIFFLCLEFVDVDRFQCSDNIVVCSRAIRATVLLEIGNVCCRISIVIGHMNHSSIGRDLKENRSTHVQILSGETHHISTPRADGRQSNTNMLSEPLCDEETACRGGIPMQQEGRIGHVSPAFPQRCLPVAGGTADEPVRHLPMISLQEGTTGADGCMEPTTTARECCTARRRRVLPISCRSWRPVSADKGDNTSAGLSTISKPRSAENVVS